MPCDRNIKTTVLCICEQNDPIFPQGTLKFHQRTSTKSTSCQLWVISKQPPGRCLRVELNLEVWIMETQQDIQLHYLNRLYHLTLTVRPEQRKPPSEIISLPVPVEHFNFFLQPTRLMK